MHYLRAAFSSSASWNGMRGYEGIEFFAFLHFFHRWTKWYRDSNRVHFINKAFFEFACSLELFASLLPKDSHPFRTTVFSHSTHFVKNIIMFWKCFTGCGAIYICYTRIAQLELLAGSVNAIKLHFENTQCYHVISNIKWYKDMASRWLQALIPLVNAILFSSFIPSVPFVVLKNVRLLSTWNYKNPSPSCCVFSFSIQSC